MARAALSAPNPIDLHVGQMVRARRKTLGVTQSELAVALDLTFQQVQKYERGSNRISASKLFEIARYLDTPIGALFEGLHADGSGETPLGKMVGFLKLDGAEALAAAYESLSSQQRRLVLDLAEAIGPGGKDH